MQNNHQNWFINWFDTNYYHTLYKNRDDNEASLFIETLMQFLNLPINARVGDIACGKGRHTKVLSDLGYKAWGMDLSENSIEIAKSLKLLNAEFSQHDMRLPFPQNNLDAALNLFTSFGYFENPNDDHVSIKNIYDSLKMGGWFVQDYLNSDSVVSNFPLNESKVIDGIKFDIEKFVDQGFIYKNIHVTDGDLTFDFQEKVKIFTVDELVQIHQLAGFSVERVFGDYQLNALNSKECPRIILISRK